MKIVFMEADTLGKDVDLSEFDKLGEVVKYPASKPAENAKRIEDADIIIVNKIPVNEELLKEAKNVKLVCVTATGTNIVDMPYVESRGIVVTNVKGYSTMSVAQHTFALLFYVYEKLAYYDRFVKSGTYAKSDVFSHFAKPFHELDGKVYGIIGMGAIGEKVAEIAETFGCKVIYYSTSGKHDHPKYQRVTWDEFLEQAVIVSIHAPLTPVTEKLVDAKALRKMKNTAVLLNLGRGPIVDQKALAEALQNDEIAAAGLDVLEKEPMEEGDPLLNIQDSSKLIITPHIAWATCEARKRCADEVCENVRCYLQGISRNVVSGGK